MFLRVFRVVPLGSLQSTGALKLLPNIEYTIIGYINKYRKVHYKKYLKPNHHYDSELSSKLIYLHLQFLLKTILPWDNKKTSWQADVQ